MKTTTTIIYPAFALACFALSPQAQAVCQDACLGNSNTVLGDDALISLTTGYNNTGIGFNALFSNTTGADNTAIGFQALYHNTSGSENVGVGFEALLNNTTGGANIALGDEALGANTTSTGNVAIGEFALAGTTWQGVNVAVGYSALAYNNGSNNVAVGNNAMGFSSSAIFNTAIGNVALGFNANGMHNVAVGDGAMNLSSGSFNVAVGYSAGLNFAGNGNIAVGQLAGQNVTTGANNIDIGNQGSSGDVNTIRIGTQETQRKAFIAGISATAVSGRAVMISSTGQLGVAASSVRFKDEIKPMEKASEAILALKPVTFRYKKEIDAERTPQFGLVAEDVAKVNPDLVACDEQGKPYTVRYEAVDAMLLNEFLKEHRKVEAQESKIEQQEAKIARQQKQIEALMEGLQKVSAQLKLSRSAPQTVQNSQ
jgi:hypothetical protein